MFVNYIIQGLAPSRCTSSGRTRRSQFSKCGILSFLHASGASDTYNAEWFYLRVSTSLSGP